jgi:cytochrome c556
MKINRRTHSVVVALTIALVAACSSTVDESSERANDSKDPLAIAREQGSVTINGVERTELALLMRKMHDDMVKVKDSLEQGYEVTARYTEAFARIKEAHPTEPEKIDAAYQGMADAFIQQYRQFQQSSDDQVTAFNIMLDNCLACHQHKCPGPIKAIKKLKISGQPN